MEMRVVYQNRVASLALDDSFLTLHVYGKKIPHQYPVAEILRAYSDDVEYTDEKSSSVDIQHVNIEGTQEKKEDADPSSAPASFKVVVIDRSRQRYKWKPKTLLFFVDTDGEHANPSQVVGCWLRKIGATLKNLTNRPRRLLVFVNPYGGRKQGPKIYKQKVMPLFEMANINTEVVTTQRCMHAYEYIMQRGVSEFDGVISVGGDGMFNEVLNGVVTKCQAEADIDHNNVRVHLARPAVRIGIIPAGSTDATIIGIQGVNDPVTAALHIIVGESVSADVGGIYTGGGSKPECAGERNNNLGGVAAPVDDHLPRLHKPTRPKPSPPSDEEVSLLRYFGVLNAYGFFGDTVRVAREWRVLSPIHDLLAGVKAMVQYRKYAGDIHYLPSETLHVSNPRDTQICTQGCGWCAKVGSQTQLAGVLEESKQDWQVVSGSFLAVNAVTMSCMSPLSPKGLSPYCHLGDGCIDIILVRNTARVNYARYLLQTFLGKGNTFALPYVEVFRVKEFKFVPEAEGPVSTWNTDGEVVTDPAIHVKTHCQLIKVFGRGLDPEENPSSVTTAS